MAKDRSKETFLKRYWLLLSGLGGLLGLLILFSIRLNFWVTPPSPVTSSPLDPPPLPPLTSPTPSPDDDGAVNPSPVPPAATPSPTGASTFPANAVPQGQFRVSNQTNHPIRVALLPQQPGDLPSPESPAENTPAAPPVLVYGEPVHWDFAPEEGSAKGLLLSLPEGNLQLQGGEVLMAFAQDGSRRYWGPYVVGKTSMPVWNTGAQEWELVLQP